MDRSERIQLSYEIVKGYFKEKEGIELVRARNKPCDLISLDEKVFVEVKSIKENLWNIGRISDDGYKLAQNTKANGTRYSVHIIKFVDEDSAYEHYIIDANDLHKFLVPDNFWAFTDDLDNELPRMLVETSPVMR